MVPGTTVIHAGGESYSRECQVANSPTYIDTLLAANTAAGIACGGNGGDRNTISGGRPRGPSGLEQVFRTWAALEAGCGDWWSLEAGGG